MLTRSPQSNSAQLQLRKPGLGGGCALHRRAMRRTPGSLGRATSRVASICSFFPNRDRVWLSAGRQWLNNQVKSSVCVCVQDQIVRAQSFKFQLGIRGSARHDQHRNLIAMSTCCRARFATKAIVASYRSSMCTVYRNQFAVPPMFAFRAGYVSPLAVFVRVGLVWT